MRFLSSSGKKKFQLVKSPYSSYPIRGKHPSQSCRTNIRSFSKDSSLASQVPSWHPPLCSRPSLFYFEIVAAKLELPFPSLFQTHNFSAEMSFDSSRSSSTSQGKGNKRKKSLDSNSSIQTFSRKSHQKTLGMAWGANSLSSSKSSARNSPFSDFGRYLLLSSHPLTIIKCSFDFSLIRLSLYLNLLQLHGREESEAPESIRCRCFEFFFGQFELSNRSFPWYRNFCRWIHHSF